MERPNEQTVAYFARNVPDAPNVVRGQMFGHPCAFVHGNMFFGTFAQSVVLRVGAAEAAALVGRGHRYFEPMAGRAWKDYVQIEAGSLPDGELGQLAARALDFAALLPPKLKAAKRPPKQK